MKRNRPLYFVFKHVVNIFRDEYERLSNYSGSTVFVTIYDIYVRCG